MGRGLLPAPSCALPRHAGVGSREQAQPPFPLRGGRPPGPGGAEGRACGSPAAVGAGGGGGGWGGRPLARPRVCAGGGGGEGLGGALWPPGDASRRPWGGGAGAAWRPWFRGPAIGQGVAPVTRPPYRELDARAGPRRGPHLPGRCRVAPVGRGWLMVSGQWLAGCGAAGSSPRLAPPHSSKQWKSTFSYSPLVLWWPPLSHFRKKGIFLGLSLVSTSTLKYLQY